jgi:hypothetical protein
MLALGLPKLRRSEGRLAGERNPRRDGLHSPKPRLDTRMLGRKKCGR